jgi:hypothetical protein
VLVWRAWCRNNYRQKISKQKNEYVRIWVYIPTKVSEDTAFPFEIGTPCLAEIDDGKRQLTVKTTSEKEAI